MPARKYEREQRYLVGNIAVMLLLVACRSRNLQGRTAWYRTENAWNMHMDLCRATRGMSFGKTRIQALLLALNRQKPPTGSPER
eukprot:5173740-Pleurochrysis_carterae.AAC.1